MAYSNIFPAKKDRIINNVSAIDFTEGVKFIGLTESFR